MFRILVVDLNQAKGRSVEFRSAAEVLGGSGLAAAMFSDFARPDARWDNPDQPIIFAIGALTGYFPLMSKAVMAFLSPYHGHYAESHAGGRLALSMRFAGYDGIVVQGTAPRPSCLVVGHRTLELLDVHYLRGFDVLSAGKWLRRIHSVDAGHRSILRIGPGGENRVAFASVNVDTYRHFGRLGGGAVMGAKNLKAIIVVGDGNLDLPGGKEYPKLCQSLYDTMTQSTAMRKYHDLGTPMNLLPLNEMGALPCRNLQATRNEKIGDISGERFADELLLRKTACAGCPVGCIHVGLLREQFGAEHEFLYRQVSYDYEPIFAAGSMLGIMRPDHVLTLLEEAERQGLDVMSAGVALAWATEALENRVVTERETLIPLVFGDVEGYRLGLRHLAERSNEFYEILGQGTLKAAQQYGGKDFACVLGQEMAGYATGETFFVSQAYGLRHSHLDSAGYGFDQTDHPKDVEAAVTYLIEEERRRVGLTCMVSCLFARNVYAEERLQEALTSIGRQDVADVLPERSKEMQALRWRMKFACGFKPEQITIPKRFREVQTWKGKIDREFMHKLSESYVGAISRLVQDQLIKDQVQTQDG